MAVGVGLLYMLWRGSGWRSHLHKGANTTLLILLLLLTLGIGVGQRSWEALSGDDNSVSHRLVLWRYGLQMAIDNPLGFGAGNSGTMYRQWYQPLGMTENYRTLVNSYLTLLVEHGWLIFISVLGLALLFWNWAQPSTREPARGSIIAGLRASLLAFGVCSFFSTVMEEWGLWVVPALCVAVLTIWALAMHTRVAWRMGENAFLITMAIVASWWLRGKRLADRDSLQRQFAKTEDGVLSSCRIQPRTIGYQPSEWLVIPDARIMGEEYGRLVRRLALDNNIAVRVKTSFTSDCCVENALVIGASAAQSSARVTRRLILLAPEIMDTERAVTLLASAPQILVLLPEIDEDGRAEFWTRISSRQQLPAVKVHYLPGIGLRVDWAWNQVLAWMSALG